MSAQPLPVRAPRREDYFSIVKAMRPWIGEEELTLRSSLLLMRDRSIATKEIACEPAWVLLNVVQQQAEETAMNGRVSIDDLREIRRLCLNCIAAASSFNTLYQPRKATDAGG